MKILSPEAEVLLTNYSYDEIMKLSDTERVPLLRDIVRRSNSAALCTTPLALTAVLPAVAALQLTFEFPGKVRFVTIAREEVLQTGVHRRNPVESHLYHADSEQFEADMAEICINGMQTTDEMLDAGVNVGEAFSALPLAATVTVILTGNVIDFRRLYETCGKRKGFLHPACLEVSIDAIVEWKRLAPNLMRALDTLSE